MTPRTKACGIVLSLFFCDISVSSLYSSCVFHSLSAPFVLTSQQTMPRNSQALYTFQNKRRGPLDCASRGGRRRALCEVGLDPVPSSCHCLAAGVQSPPTILHPTSVPGRA